MAKKPSIKSWRKEVAELEAPITRERNRIKTLPKTPALPGLEYMEEPPVVIRSDGLWKNAEKTLKFIAELGGYSVRTQQRIGKIDGCWVVVDLICSLSNKDDVVISCKFQREEGSFDEKVAAEAVKLRRLLPRDGIARAYIVTVGSGANLKKGLHWDTGVLNGGGVRVICIDHFLQRAWCQAL